MHGGSINAILCDDLLYRILVVDLGTAAAPIMARVCKRWQAVISAAPDRWRDQFIEETAANVVAAGVAPGRLLVGWAARVRFLEARAGARFLHVGHLIAAVAQGHAKLAAWMRRQQHPWVDCDPDGKDDDAHGLSPPTRDIACFFCPRCGGGREADVWPWACALREGNARSVVADLDALIAVRGPITDRQRRCWSRALHLVLPLLARSGDIDLVTRFLKEDLLERPWHSRWAIWRAAATAGRLDLLQWAHAGGHATDESTFDTPYRPDGEHPKMTPLSKGAARAGAIDALNWIDATWPESSNSLKVFEAALRGGHSAVLDWLDGKYPRMIQQQRHPGEPRLLALHAALAPSPSSLEWMRAKGLVVPIDLLRMGGQLLGALPKSPAIVDYAVDVLGCAPLDAPALVRASKADRLDLVRQAHGRGWINNNALYRRMWSDAVRKGASGVASWLAANPPSAAAPRPPFDICCRGDGCPPVETLARQRLAGIPWHPRRSLNDDGTRLCTPICIIWALSHGCPMPQQWRFLSRDGIVTACSRSIVHGRRPTRHPHPLYLATAAPLLCMDAFEAAGIQARIDVARIVEARAGSWVRDHKRTNYNDTLVSLRHECDSAATVLEHLARIVRRPRSVATPTCPSTPQRANKRRHRRSSKKSRR
ncbi:hypothetical protein pneo_cds_1075 [Pandoravirus neocaledonia]|uniref:Uncharacterized protein n=1 Tax=Pandoravirus neocaledonia TaxID=2107708 RepID=A0A2U7UE46_9VIRU|nr:hypothetical protein pneo_cds_1075 [Pandoravirus neocaledonia]AVK76682.1 hypothetical protein pneo_cds_1075 [Pandoravirus neocaledonia]